MLEPQTQAIAPSVQTMQHPFSEDGWIQEVFEFSGDLYCLKAVDEIPPCYGLYLLNPEEESGELLCCIPSYQIQYANGCLYYADANNKRDIMVYDIATGQHTLFYTLPEGDRAAVQYVDERKLIFSTLFCDEDEIVTSS